MSYQVLARKYRSRTFEELMGQEHVVQALANALTQQRLHHAYLFTGTRGVGKTSVSRILAKSLNCIGPDGTGGITAHPCNVCDVCRDIDAGRFVDYVELDAASNRGVEEISQLLDQAVYKPVVGRFKVYMIDEVHMLSNTAFNAMLKTLEEPPEYLKFVLATTDPQKVPVTVLSRCLQFNLRPMAPQTVLEHLARVLANEQVPNEPGALRLLARAARGSMRDALSLTDQAIAFGSGKLEETGVRQMLGSVDRGHVLGILNALIAGDGAALVGASDRLRDMGLSAGGTLEDLAVALQQLAIAQAAPGALDAGDPDLVELLPLAAQLPADEIQLMYSMALHGRQELPLAPDEYAGLTMVLLRMMAFRPNGQGARQPTLPEAAARSTPAAAPMASAAPVRPPAVNPPAPQAQAAEPAPAPTPAPAVPRVAEAALPDPEPEPAAAPAAAPEPAPAPAPALAPAPAPAPEPAPAAVAAAPRAPSGPLRAATAGAPATRFSERLRPRAAPAPAEKAESDNDEPEDLSPPHDDDGPPPWMDVPPPSDEEAAVGMGMSDLDDPMPDGGDSAGAPGGSGASGASGAAGGIYLSTAIEEVELVPTPMGERWYATVSQLGLNALSRELALQAECLEIDDAGDSPRWRFRVERESLRQPALLDKLQAALTAFIGKPARVEIETGRATDSPALRDTMAARSRQRQAESIILEDPEVRQLLAQFKTARILPGSIKPV